MNEITLPVAPELILQSARPEHAAAFFDLVARNRDHIGRYLPKVTAIDSLEKAQAHLARCVEQRATGESFDFDLFWQGSLCGALRLNHFEPEGKKGSIAYLIDARLEGRGLVTRSARALLAFAFGELSLNRVELRCVTSNERSVRMAERLGFTREGELREAEWLDGRPFNHYVYGLLRREFEAGG